MESCSCCEKQATCYLIADPNRKTCMDCHACSPNWCLPLSDHYSDAMKYGMENRDMAMPRPYGACIDCEKGTHTEEGAAHCRAFEAEVIKNLGLSKQMLTKSETANFTVHAEYLTTSQAAQLTGFSTRALEAMRVKGGGPRFCRVGGGKTIRYPVADLRRWIESEGE